MAAESIGSVFLELRANASGMRSDVAKGMNSVSTLIKRHSDKILLAGKALAAGATVAAGAIVAFTKSGIDSIGTLVDTATKLNITAASLAGFQHAAKLAGVEAKTLETGMIKMASSVVNAAKGMKAPESALRELGLQASELLKLPIDRQFSVIVEKLSEVDNAAKKIQLARDIFGRGGADLIPLIKAGAQGLAEAAQEARDFGLALSQVDAAKVEKAGDDMDRLGAMVKGASQQMAIGFAPAISMAVEKLVAMNKEGQGIQKVAEWTRELIDAMIAAGGTIAVLNLKFQEGYNRARALIEAFIAFTAESFNKIAEFMRVAMKSTIEVLASGLETMAGHWNAFMSGIGNDSLRVPDLSLSADFLAKPAVTGLEKVAISAREAQAEFNELAEASSTAADQMITDTANIIAAMDSGPSDGLLGGAIDPAAQAALDAATAEAAALNDEFKDIQTSVGGIPPLIQRVNHEMETLSAIPISNSLEGMNMELRELHEQLGFMEIGSEAFTRTQEKVDRLGHAIEQVAVTHESAFSKMQRKTAETVNSMNSLFDNLSSNLSEVFQTGKFDATSFLDTLKRHFADQAARAIMDPLKNAFTGAAQAANQSTGQIKNSFGSMFNNIGSAATGWLSWLGNAFSSVASGIGSAVSGLFRSGTGTASTGASVGSGVANVATKAATSAVTGSSFWTGIAGGVGSLLGGWAGGALAGYAGGGYTGDAPRSGGMDGQGGFLAMMHPKETVVDHTKFSRNRIQGTQATAPNVFNFQISSGVQRAELASLLPVLAGEVRRSIAKDAAKGGFRRG